MLEGNNIYLDNQRVAKLLNKHIIIGITKKNNAGTLLEQKQMHGDINVFFKICF